MVWKRQVSVIVSTNDGKTILNTTNHRIDFEYYSTLGFGGDYGTVTIYNLSENESDALQSREFGYLSIQLNAGYVDSTDLENYQKNINSVTPLVFDGTITNAVASKEGTEGVTRIHCTPLQVLQWSKMSLTLPGVGFTRFDKDTTLSFALAGLAATVGMTVKYSGVPDEVLNYKFTKGRVLNSTLVDELTHLCNEFNLSFYITPAFVIIYPKQFGSVDTTQLIEDTSKVIKVTPGMLQGDPVATVSSIEMSLLLNTSIMPGMMLDTTGINKEDSKYNYINFNEGYKNSIDSTIIQTGLSDLYQVETVVHFGSTHTNTYKTDLVGRFGVDTTIGGNNHWRDWCAKTYGMEFNQGQSPSLWD
ncbi:hypothetical protein [Lelliottia wanjuensis]|uniref:Uncharacterized protein n=1 Tax=Lelliottia wanjuensis TaxID=3050585 RepID=A0AAP4FZC0_9ENTR|nr:MULTISPECIES: hypothetical protein [unclassified Lelliottia]MDK9366443.1 hypothetical protein [Lelliottia sp. V106_12]MDK9618688.1 hypothetical protein [Lelliottia sp. V106_9]